jgi:hypothetical protein
MPTVVVTNSTTGDMGIIAAKRTRYEKAEVAYGKIPADAYAVDDTLSFDDIPMKELIHARLVSNGEVKELFHGDDISSAVAFDISNTAATADISYVITYIRGTGQVKTSATTAGEGKLLQVTVAST